MSTPALHTAEDHAAALFATADWLDSADAATLSYVATNGQVYRWS